ncbi:alpha/beta hydrolase [Citricoccus sp. I39-566]|uniref:alpha/beta hydrolase n=1 Tax=Citricoccus sp. I39-566 TaxID=3073268 RepID=UPI00286B79C1|nr:alpha/beta hydrolase [Citricoccus sp. I39-566]WMY78280.1 alpha/beta hydrolase [Citricoccus sp. I39-566]
MTLPALKTYPAVEADWDALSDAAADLRTESKNTRESMEDATSSWRGFRTWYRHDGTQDVVWTGLDTLAPHAEDWASALSSAKDAVDDFVTTGRPLQSERESLDRAEPGLSSRRSAALSSEDEAEVEEVRSDIVAFNERATALQTDWDNAQETFESAIGAIALGTTDGLPTVTAARDADTDVLDWAGMTSELDERFGEIDPKSIWRDLRGLSEDELRDWLEANPEAARALAENDFPGDPVPGSAEDIMAEAMADDAQLSEEGVAGIRDAWLGLEDHERERLMLLFPGVIGNLNGIPLATRGQTNHVTVAGLREQTAERLAEHRDNRPQHAPGNAYERGQWEDEEKRLETVLDGLGQAWAAYGEPHFPRDKTETPGYSTVFVSTDGLGQIATMRGEPSADTQRAVTFVPGTNTTIASVDHYNDALNAMDGDDADGTVSIYWQGTPLPQDLVRDNATPHYNEEGAPLLAAFDHAADLEMASDRHRDVPTTYVGHSAGGSLLGTAEREGLDSTNIVYVAPAGNGHEVSSPEDTENEYAYRYLIQTNDDPISWAQALGGGAQSGSFWEGSNPVQQMGAVRLESGLQDDGSIMEGHTDYFERGSTSARNIEGVVYGEDVSPYLEPEIHTYPGSTQPVITYPLEQDLEHYRQHGIPQVPVGSLHDAD